MKIFSSAVTLIFSLNLMQNSMNQDSSTKVLKKNSMKKIEMFYIFFHENCFTSVYIKTIATNAFSNVNTWIFFTHSCEIQVTWMIMTINSISMFFYTNVLEIFQIFYKFQ